jgi:hypothetical protein
MRQDGTGVGEADGTRQRLHWSEHACQGAPCPWELHGTPTAWAKAEAAQRQAERDQARRGRAASKDAHEQGMCWEGCLAGVVACRGAPGRESRGAAEQTSGDGDWG